MSASSIWRQTQKQGQRLLECVERHREQVRVEHIQLPDGKHDHEQRKGMSVDGGMVNIRHQGWRELKVGTVFDVDLRLERNPQTRELDEMAHGVNVHYTAILGTKDAFSPRTLVTCCSTLPTARNQSVVADGALWIWDVAEDICPNGQQVVDWYHAVEHLHKASLALYPNDDEAHNRSVGSKPTKIICIWDISTPLFLFYTSVMCLNLPLISSDTNDGCNISNFEKTAYPLARALLKVALIIQATVVWHWDAA